jgi:hypothetical protein
MPAILTISVLTVLFFAMFGGSMFAVGLIFWLNRGTAYRDWIPHLMFWGACFILLSLGTAIYSCHDRFLHPPSRHVVRLYQYLKRKCIACKHHLLEHDSKHATSTVESIGSNKVKNMFTKSPASDEERGENSLATIQAPIPRPTAHCGMPQSSSTALLLALTTKSNSITDDSITPFPKFDPQISFAEASSVSEGEIANDTITPAPALHQQPHPEISSPDPTTENPRQ